MKRSFLLLAVVGLGGCGWSETTSIRPYEYDRDPSTTKEDGTRAPSPTVGTTVDDPCVDPNGFAGLGCYKCAPKTSEQLLSACTPSRYETFDNARRIPDFDPSNPRPEMGEQGPTPPAFEPAAGSTTDPLPPPPACALDAKPNPVMILGATGFPMETLAKAMGKDATIYFQEAGSCDAVAAMVLRTKLEGVVTTYDSEGQKSRCSLGESHPPDLALSALFASSCGGQAGLADAVALPSDVEDALGPTNPVMLATPATSKERAISAEAAYRVFGMAGSSRVAPWNDERYVFRRRSSSGNQQTVARTLGIPADLLRGRDSNGSSNMLSALLSTDDPTKTIGISSSEIVDTNRDSLKALAYKHYGQPVAFYPDSDPGSLDRRNVRDGHYFMWIPLHVFAKTVSGDPVAAANLVLDPDGSRKSARDATVKRLLYVMVSRQQAPVRGVDLFGAMKRQGNVPSCAMKVRRAKDGAPLEPYAPALSCGCAFEAAAPGNTGAECKACRDSSECSGAKSTCSFGFCE